MRVDRHLFGGWKALHRPRLISHHHATLSLHRRQCSLTRTRKANRRPEWDGDLNSMMEFRD